MKKGDQCFFYHSNIGKEIVGIVEVIKEHYLIKQTNLVGLLL
jgi:predicted RNA-binding protein with PUA-like domain